MSSADTKKTKTGAKVPQPTKGYRGHKPGSRKETVHQLFDREGADTAWTRGLKMKLKEGTLRSWFGQWGRSASKPKPRAKTPPKATEKTDRKPATAMPMTEAISAPEPAVLPA